MSVDDDTRERIASAIESHFVTLFMKGSREAPRCGFSATLVGILDSLIPDYQAIDVLDAPELRDGIKSFSGWPTIPQLYVGGEFLGGCEEVRELRQLIEAETAQPAADRGDAGILLHLEDRAVHLVEMRQGVLALVGVLWLF